MCPFRRGSDMRQNERQPPEPESVLRERMLLFYGTSYLLFAAGGLRMIGDFYDTRYQWYLIGLLAAYIILLSTERWITRRLPYYQPVYFIVQTLDHFGDGTSQAEFRLLRDPVSGVVHPGDLVRAKKSGRLVGRIFFNLHNRQRNGFV